MRKFSLASSFLLASILATPAIAADEVIIAPLSVHDWSGFYAGVHAGGGGGSSDWTYLPPPDPANHSTSGFLGGVQAGYNWQVGNFVFGPEADISYTNIKGGTPCPNAAFTCRTEFDWLGSVRGRLGYSFDRLLVYGTGGLGFGSFTAETFNPSGSVPPSGGTTNGQNRTLVGWTLGAGAEVALSSNWSIKAEYMYYGFGSKSYLIDFGTPVRVSPNIHTGKIGVNFKW